MGGAAASDPGRGRGGGAGPPRGGRKKPGGLQPRTWSAGCEASLMVETWAPCSPACVTNARALRRGWGPLSRHPLGHLRFKPRSATSGGPTSHTSPYASPSQIPLISWPNEENKMLESTPIVSKYCLPFSS